MEKTNLDQELESSCPEIPEPNEATAIANAKAKRPSSFEPKLIILVKYEEIFLKGDNRWIFEKKLMDNMKKSLYGLGSIQITKNQGRIYVNPRTEDYPINEALQRLTRVFGINAVTACARLPKDYNLIAEKAIEMAGSSIKNSERPLNTFKVITKRADKTFTIPSMQLSSELGGLILDAYPNLKVDVNKPDFIVHIEIRDKAYVYAKAIPGAKGLPTGSGGRATLLLSGGIDSPVAGWMIGKRGAWINAVHFHSSPYTSERAKMKAIELANELAKWVIGIRLHVVSLTEIQMAINNNCPSEYGTIIMRRFMMRIAERIANESGSMALVTGEAIGQVASQTMESLMVTDSAVSIPVYRPCIGMDKNEVIDIARRIGTFDISIQPYEDCCTVFVARHPVTKPSIEKTLSYEALLGADAETFIQTALDGREILSLRAESE